MILNLIYLYVAIALSITLYDYIRWDDQKFGRSFFRLMVGFGMNMLWPILIPYLINVRIKKNKQQ
jgi:hypothetical protein